MTHGGVGFFHPPPGPPTAWKLKMTERIIPITQVPDYLQDKTGGGMVRTVKTVREWATKGIIRSRKIAGSMFVELDSVDELLSGDDENATSSDSDGRGDVVRAE